MTTDTLIEAIDQPWEASMRYSDMALAAAQAGASGEAVWFRRLAAIYMAQAIEDERLRIIRDAEG